MSNIFPPGAELAGRYRILGLTASVGIGSLFEAERLVGAGRVAFKWLRFPNASRQFSLDALVQGAQVARSFSHPCAAEIYDVVREGNSVFIASELLRGEPLLTRLSPHLLRPVERIEVLLQAMRTVAAAHGHGVVHGGVHPGNLFLQQGHDGKAAATMLDFVTSHFAALGLGIGNIPLARAVYRDREQLCGSAELDVRADVFAFGVLTYQALTGRLPFYGENAIDLAGRLLTSVLTPVAALRPEASGALDRALSAALTVSRERRPSSLHALIEALASFAAYMGTSAAPARTEAGTALMVVQRSEAGVATLRSLDTAVAMEARSHPVASTQAIRANDAPQSRDGAAKTQLRAVAPANSGRWLTRLAFASSLAAAASVALYLGSLSLGDGDGPPKVHAAGAYAGERNGARRKLPPSLPAPVLPLHGYEGAPLVEPLAQQAAGRAEERQSAATSAATVPSTVARTAPTPRAEKRTRHRLDHARNKGRKGVLAAESPFRAGLPPEVGEF